MIAKKRLKLVVVVFLSIIILFFSIKYLFLIKSPKPSTIVVNSPQQSSLSCLSSLNNHPNYTLQFKCLETLAKQGNAEAAYHLSQMYFLGLAPLKNIESGNLWLIKASLAGSESAQLQIRTINLAIKYNNKIIFLDNLFRLAVSTESNSVFANSVLATFYFRGILIPQNYESAEYYALRAAQHKNSQGQLILGLLYPYPNWTGYNESATLIWWDQYLHNHHESNLSFRVMVKSTRIIHHNKLK